MTYDDCDFGGEDVADGIFTAPSSGIYVFSLNVKMIIRGHILREMKEWKEKDWTQTLEIEMMHWPVNEIKKWEKTVDYTNGLFTSWMIDQVYYDWNDRVFKLDSMLSLYKGDKVYIRWKISEDIECGKECDTSPNSPRTEAYTLSKFFTS